MELATKFYATASSNDVHQKNPPVKVGKCVEVEPGKLICEVSGEVETLPVTIHMYYSAPTTNKRGTEVIIVTVPMTLIYLTESMETAIWIEVVTATRSVTELKGNLQQLPINDKVKLLTSKRSTSTSSTNKRNSFYNVDGQSFTYLTLLMGFVSMVGYILTKILQAGTWFTLRHRLQLRGAMKPHLSCPGRGCLPTTLSHDTTDGHHTSGAHHTHRSNVHHIVNSNHIIDGRHTSGFYHTSSAHHTSSVHHTVNAKNTADAPHTSGVHHTSSAHHTSVHHTVDSDHTNDLHHRVNTQHNFNRAGHTKALKPTPTHHDNPRFRRGKRCPEEKPKICKGPACRGGRYPKATCKGGKS